MLIRVARKRILIIAGLCLICLFVGDARAQETGLLSVTFGAGVPHGALADQITRPGVMLTAGSIDVQPDGHLAYELHRSKTAMLLPRAGFTIGF